MDTGWSIWLAAALHGISALHKMSVAVIERYHAT
jgi:hypothetical protein